MSMHATTALCTPNTNGCMVGGHLCPILWERSPDLWSALTMSILECIDHVNACNNMVVALHSGCCTPKEMSPTMPAGRRAFMPDIIHDESCLKALLPALLPCFGKVTQMTGH